MTGVAPQPEADSVEPSAAGDETATELQGDGAAAFQSPQTAAGFSMHDRRRFVNRAEFLLWLEETREGSSHYSEVNQAEFLPELEEAPESETELPAAPPSAEASESTHASRTQAELEAELETEPGEELESSLWVELQQELRRVGRELSKNTRQAEVNLQIFGEVLDEVQRLPAAYSETVWQMKAGLLKDVLSVVDGLETSLREGQQALTRLETPPPPIRPSWWTFFSSPRESVDVAAILRSWLEGQQILHRRLVSVLHSQGVEEIESVGQRFDARLHRASAREVRSDLPPGTIVTEEVKGYLLDGRVLRYAEVVVSTYEQDHRD